MAVARDTNRRGGADVAPDLSSVAAAAQARSAEVQRQLNLSVSEKKHFELVCEVMPDWNDGEIVSFLTKCNYNSSIINDALMNAFEDLRPSEDQSAADWNVQSKKSKRNKKEKTPTTPGELSSDRRHSGPRDRSERHEPHDRPDRFERCDRSERRDRKDQPTFDRRPKRDFSKPEGAPPKAAWSSSGSCNWGEAQPTIASDAAAAAAAAGAVGAWGDPIQSPETSDVTSSWSPTPTSNHTSIHIPTTTTTTTTPSPHTSPSIHQTSTSCNQDAIITASPATPVPTQPKPMPSTSTISWAGITKRSLEKPVASAPSKAESPKSSKPASDSEPKPSPSGWDSEEATVGQWGAPEPALATDSVPNTASDAEIPEPASPELEPSSPSSAPDMLPPHDVQAEIPSVPVLIQPSTEDLLTASGPVILPQFVAQQAVLNPTMIQFGTFSIADDSEMVSPNAECVRIHSANADFTQQQLLQQQEHEMAVEDPTDVRNSHHEYVNEPAIPMHQFYPPFLNSMHSYMPYEADTTSMPAYFEPYNQQRVQRPRQQSYSNPRNNKTRRDHRNNATNNNPRQAQQSDECPAQPIPSNDQATGGFTQGVSERDSQGVKSGGMDSSSRSGTGGARGNKQRQGDRSRGGLSSGGYHHPSYAGNHIPVGYGQPYAYPAPYLPQFYGQNQQGYGPPGFRQHYSQYQNASNYQQAYQSGMPRSAYTEYVDTAGMHQTNAFGQHQGEAGPTPKQSESEHASPDQSVLYPFEHQAWPDQHRYVLQQQQPHQAQGNEPNTTETASEGISLPHSSFDRRGDVSPSQSASFGYSGQQQYSQAHSYQNFSTQHQYNDSSNRSYPHWASHQ